MSDHKISPLSLNFQVIPNSNLNANNKRPIAELDSRNPFLGGSYVSPVSVGFHIDEYCLVFNF